MFFASLSTACAAERKTPESGPPTNAEFLELSEGQQHWWYAGAVTSIGHVVFLHDKEKAQCVWDWFFDDPDSKKLLLERSFEKYPDHTPTSVILALLKRDCGELLPINKL